MGPTGFLLLAAGVLVVWRACALLTSWERAKDVAKPAVPDRVYAGSSALSGYPIGCNLAFDSPFRTPSGILLS